VIYPPPPLWTPPRPGIEIPTIWLPGRSPKPQVATPRDLLLGPPGSPFRPPAATPTIVQTAVAHNTGVTFGATTTIGNLLIGMAGRRQADPGAPTDGGTWTSLGVAWSNHNVENDTVRIYGRTVTAAQTFYSWNPGGSSPVVVEAMVELSGAGLGGSTQYAAPNNGGPATVLDIGDLGTLSSFQYVFGIWVNTADLITQTVTPSTGWTRLAYGNRDEFTTSSNSLTGFGGFPFVWAGYLLGSGVDRHARIDIDAAKNWSGLALALA